MRVRGPLSVLFASALILLAAAPVFAAEVLIFGPSEGIEGDVATGGGHTVTVADEATWTAMTTEQFAAFDAIVIGDAGCESADGILDAAIANRATWSAAVNGPITVSTFDPGAHTDGAGGNQEEELTLNSVDFAASGPGTGLYFAVGCYYNNEEEPVVPLTILDEFGEFIVDGFSGDEITIVDGTHPVMTGLTEEGLSDWGSSIHEHFLTFPASFSVLATATGEISIEGTEGPVPLPVVLAQGATVTPTPTPTPSPTPVVSGSPAPTASPAASQLPDTTAGAPADGGSPMVAGMLLLASVSLMGIAVLRRRGVLGSR